MTFAPFYTFPTATDWPAPLGDDALHGLAGDVVRVIEPHTESDPAAILVEFLAAAGNAIGRGPHARAENDIHAGNLFAAIVGDTSKARKGTGWSRVRSVVNEADSGWASNIAGGLSSGEGLIWAVRDEIVTRRRARGKDERERADENGYLEEVEDAGVDDKRLLVVEGEFAQPLRVMRRESNTLSSVLRNLWDHGDVRTMVKNSPAKTTGAHVSIVAHCTTTELRKELTAVDSANGFANRFLWACSRRSKLLPDGGQVAEQDVRLLGDCLRDVINWAQTPRELRRSDSAGDLWHEVYGPLSEGQPGLVGNVTSRAEAQVLRLSVIFAALDCKSVIEYLHLKAALEVWRYCQDSAAYIFQDHTGNPDADRIHEALTARHNGAMSRTEIRNLFGGSKRAADIENAITTLEQLGTITRNTTATGGRPTETIHLHGREETEEREQSHSAQHDRDAELQPLHDAHQVQW